MNDKTKAKITLVKKQRTDVQKFYGSKAVKRLSATTCYALKHYFYDHYEWELVSCVSFDPEKLKKQHKEMMEKHEHTAPLWTDLEHDSSESDKEHWVIEEVEFLA